MSLLARYRTDIRETLSLSLPLIIGQVGQVLVLVADNIMVGQLGTEELAAISLGIAIFSIFFVVGLGISFALPPLVSEYFGKKDEDKIRSSLANSMLVNLAYALIMVILAESLKGKLYHLGQEPEVVDLAIPYLRLSVYSLFPFMIFQAFRFLTDGMGKTVISMQALLVGNAVNILLNYFLIFGKAGFPELGVTGAGLSSLIARILMVVVWLALIWGRPAFRKPVLSLFRPQIHWNEIQTILSLGVVTSLQMLFEVGLFSASTLMMGMIDEVAQAAHQISLNIITVTFMVTTGVSAAATIRVGQLSGSGSISEVRAAGFAAIVMSAVFMAGTGLVLFLFRQWLPYIYIQDVEVIELAALLLTFAALFQVSDGVQVTALGALRGLQDVKRPALFTFIAYMLVGLPVGWLAGFYFELGPSGIWIGLLVGLSLSALMNSLRFWKISA